jgi:hypothetical protein
LVSARRSAVTRERARDEILMRHTVLPTTDLGEPLGVRERLARRLLLRLALAPLRHDRLEAVAVGEHDVRVA